MEFLSDIYHKRIVETHTEVRETYQKLGMMLSVLDTRLSEIYHSIEKTDDRELDAIAYTSQLKSVLTRRRVVKDEMARLKPFASMAKQALNEIEVRYEGAMRKSFEIRQRLNVTMSLDDVMTEMGIEPLKVSTRS